MSRQFIPRADWRLRAYDYTLPGPYFVTQALSQRHPRFGVVHEDGVSLNTAGEMMRDVWTSLPQRYPSVELDEYIIMPDHLHCILTLHRSVEDLEPPSLTDVMGDFRSRTTVRYIQGVKAGIWPSFSRPLWEHHFHDHIIRDERDMESRRIYILRNPSRWLEKRRA